MITNEDAAELLGGLDFGSTVAELDNLLETARVETSVFDDLLADRVDLIPGTKGSGKTALYRMFVDFLPKMMLTNKKIIIAHGVQQRQDTVFLAYKAQFDKLSESDFVDFWCIYVVSLAYEQFVRQDRFKKLLVHCEDEIAAFRKAYRDAGIPDFDHPKTLHQILAWTLAVLARLKPRVIWKPPADVGQFELSLSGGAPLRQSALTALTSDDPRMPAYIDNIALCLEELLVKSGLYLWLMVDRLDELFARRSDTETRALRGLLRTLSLFRSDRIRVKVFLRDDILDQIVAGQGFTALTHVTARRSDTLRWSEEQILTMIVRRIFAHPVFASRFEIDLALLRSSIEYQRQQFYKIFVATIYRPPNQSATLRWIYNHTKDGKAVVTPRDVIALLTRAIQWQRDAFRQNRPGTTAQLITAPAIIYGLEELSKEKRATYLEAEFPHKWDMIQKLIGGGTEYTEQAINKLFGKKHQGAAEDLISVGVLERGTKKGKTTFRVPFLYRRGLECTQRFVAD
jgi:hypothetical protein